MIDLLMLGIVPGTNIQISFADWLMIIATLTCIMMLLFVVRYRMVMILLMAHAIYRARHHMRSQTQGFIAS